MRLLEDVEDELYETEMALEAARDRIHILEQRQTRLLRERDKLAG